MNNYFLSDLDTGWPLNAEGNFAQHTSDVPTFETQLQANQYARDHFVTDYKTENIRKLQFFNDAKKGVIG